MSENPRATKIRIEFDDGSVSTAEGDHAAEVYAWWNSCEFMNHLHGNHYKGRIMIKEGGPAETPEPPKE